MGCFERSIVPSFCGYSGAYIRGLIRVIMEKMKNKCKAVFHSSGCLGCFPKAPHIIIVDEQSKGQNIHGQGVKKPSFSEDFWSTSTGDMDNSAIHSSQRSISPISMSNDSQPTESENHGLLLWNQTRQQWTGNKGLNKHAQAREPSLSSNATYEDLLGTEERFPKPIPLSEMVDFLVDVWKQEGLYD